MRRAPIFPLIFGLSWLAPAGAQKAASPSPQEQATAAGGEDPWILNRQIVDGKMHPKTLDDPEPDDPEPRVELHEEGIAVPVPGRDVRITQKD